MFFFNVRRNSTLSSIMIVLGLLLLHLDTGRYTCTHCGTQSQVRSFVYCLFNIMIVLSSMKITHQHNVQDYISEQVEFDPTHVATVRGRVKGKRSMIFWLNRCYELFSLVHTINFIQTKVSRAASAEQETILGDNFNSFRFPSLSLPSLSLSFPQI